MLLSRLRPSKKKQSEDQTSKKKAQKIPELEDFLLKRDYGGACSLLEFGQKGGWDETRALWLGHCYFRGGDYKKAADTYEELMKKPTYPPEVPVYLGCCYFFMGMYADAKNAAEKIPKSSLQNRLMFHASHKLNDEKKLMLYHQQLAADNVEDQLSLASIHYMRMHYAEAIEIYKKILQQNPSLVALNVYIAMCYFKMDYFDVAQEMLQIYLDQYPQSPAALNLRACISYKTYNGKTAIPEIESLLRKSLYPAARDLLNHNMVVFKDGDGALQILPALMDVMPEARVNLIIYHLKKGHTQDALKLCDDLEPQLPTEFLAKAITFAYWGQLKDSKEHLKTAEQYFKMVGESAAECDTILGRQSMASSYFLQGKYDEVLVYLNSIKAYHQQDDTFSFNLGQTLLMCKQYKEAEEQLLAVTGQERDKILYRSMLARTLIQNRKPHAAWDLYARTKDTKEAFYLLKLIANDYYKAGEYFHAAKAFNQLEKIDPSPEYWQGKRGAACGVFRHLCHGRVTPDQMSEILGLLERDNHPQADFVVSTIRKWAVNHKIDLK